MLLLLGPTASGKTALGIEIAQKTGGAVVSADSRQVYAGLNIGTAKPREAWRDNPHDILQPDVIDSVSHYLLNVVSPATPDTLLPTPYSLAEWQPDAYAIIDHLFEQGQQPILVGGTMLYIDSIIFNYHIPTVPPNPELRRELTARPVNELYQRLLTHDPAAAEFIEAHHQQRIIRALEVIEATGQPFSATRQQSPARYPLTIIGLLPDWEVMRKNIERRAQQMLDDGLIEETRALQEQYSPALPLLQTINYKQAAVVIAGALTPEEAVTEMSKVTWRYARRQMSWWKNRKDIQWFDRPDTSTILRKLNIS